MSLKWRLLLLFAGATFVVWLGVAAFLYRGALSEIDALYDLHLAQSARVLLAVAETGADRRELHELVALLPKLIPSSVPWTHAIDEYPDSALIDSGRTIAFQLVTREGSVLLSSEGAPDQPLGRGVAGFSDNSIDATRWRVYGVADPKRARVLYVGEDHGLREQLARHLVSHLLLPIPFAVPPLLVLLWLAVMKGLAPLGRLAAEIKSRDPRDLAPLRMASVPNEVKPVASALDALFARLDRAIANEREFTGNAAHELRTPVAALRLQAQVAKRATDDSQRQRALDRIVAGADHAGHLVDQLLTLARLDAQESAPTFGPVDLLDLARRTAEALQRLAGERAVRLQIEGEEEALALGDETSIGILLRNLMDNAIRYTPACGEVKVIVKSSGHFNRLIVEDTGPGIADGEHAELFQRFRRGSETIAPGSGLGLSIVCRICELHEGSCRLENRKEGGLRSEVRLPSFEGPQAKMPAARRVSRDRCTSPATKPSRRSPTTPL